MKYLLLILLAFGLTYTGNAQIYVDASGKGNGDGTSWPDAFLTIQEAFNVAQKGDQIWVAAGTYRPTKDTSGNFAIGNKSASFILKQEVVLLGGFAGTESTASERNPKNNPTILSGDIGIQGDTTDNCNTILWVKDVPNSKIDGFSIINGNTDPMTPFYQGAISVLTDFEITNCDFAANRATRGAAIACQSGTLIVSHCTFTDNVSTQQGGAIYVRSDKASTIEFCRFENNASNFGGALKFEYTVNSPHIVNQCVFRQNKALGGGNGAAIQLFATKILINNCTFYNNLSSGFFAHSISYLDMEGIEIFNSIFHTANQTNHVHQTGGNGLDASVKNCLFPNTVFGVANIIGIPQLADSSFFYSLTACSPARNAGDSKLFSSLPSEDINGRTRLVEGKLDIGATEYADDFIKISNPDELSYSFPIAANSIKWYDCTNDKVIDGETNINYTPSASGTYAAIVTHNGCVDTSECITLTKTSISPFESPNASVEELKLYPNPSNGKVYLEVEEDVKLFIYSAYGQLIRSISLKAYEKSSIVLDEAGIYFILAEDKSYSKRFVIR